ncbi:hypothetical protein C7H19_03900 [Aphanothece hegewaldii CCALA 016]|uniref:PEP-CTERM sorting domain-containing protein n=1 Tax=Aphanothece hegewaldii CCALA 016 TaxID=2107694 RepID=A0A2T1M1R9_9CHRO|nr:heparin lyase I family protein [Aphanothece hegewaldii]PSF38659.1 hypothetical protein C7H19_03900 [Aphanothece hegewaldii CCALA 016]
MISSPQKNPLTIHFCNSLLSKLAISIVALPLTLVSTPSEAAIIKQYDFESGNYNGVNRQYQDKTCSKSSDYIDNSLFDIVDSPGGRSGKAVRHNIENCDERSEFVVPIGTLKAGEEYWIGWSMLLPTNHNTPGRESYTITQQMSFQNTCWVNANGPNCNNLLKLLDGSIVPLKGAPINALRPSVDGTSLEYHLFNYLSTDSQGRHLFELKIFTMPAMVNKWQDFVMYLDLSSDPNEARFKLWKNDKLYINEAVRLLPPGVGNLGDWKYGAYNGEPGNGERTLYTDELRVGDSASTYLDVVNPVRRSKLIGLQQNPSSADFQLLAAEESSIDAASVPEPSMLAGLLTIVGAALSLKLKRN